MTNGTERWQAVGMTEDEYRRLVSLLGREPNDLELEMAGVMWSEHCSYKSSRVHLARLPGDGEQVLLGPGENAGVLAIGGDTAVALRCESHNHPSAIDPFQGAATGVGGILRDILAVGARPFAVLNSLRLGDPRDARQRERLRGIIAGIADYGTRAGVPAVGGEVYFDATYNDNPLVNVMCVGVLPADKVVRGRAEGVGNPVFVAGKPTGREGIHAASLLASREFSEDEEAAPAAGPAGDPAVAKALIEACLDVMASGAVAGVNDLGAAGLTSAASETASRAGQGVEIDVGRVPCAVPGLSPYEIMLSETQERMLLIVKRGREEEVRRAFAARGLVAAEIGVVTDDGMLRVRDGEQVLAELPARVLTEQAPRYERPSAEPADLAERWVLPAREVPQDDAQDGSTVWEARLEALLQSPDLCSRGWLARQVAGADQDDAVPPAGTDALLDAAVLRVPGAGERGIALSIDGNSRYVWLDPYRGTQLAVAEAARNVACSGARPLGLTNCLNFGNPERPEIMWQFSRAIDGLADAARALKTPVTGGNVSFYNETGERNIFPTPVVGMVGVLEDVSRALPSGWRRAGDVVLLLGPLAGAIEASAYLQVCEGRIAGRPPAIDLALEARLIDVLVEAARAGLLQSAHDLSDGGLAVALAEACFAGAGGRDGLGVQVTLAAAAPAAGAAGDAAQADAAAIERLLFGEAPSRVLVSCRPDDVAAFERMAAQRDVPCRVLGETGGASLRVMLSGQAAPLIDRPLAVLNPIWREAMATWMRA